MAKGSGPLFRRHLRQLFCLAAAFCMRRFKTLFLVALLTRQTLLYGAIDLRLVFLGIRLGLSCGLLRGLRAILAGLIGNRISAIGKKLDIHGQSMLVRCFFHVIVSFRLTPVGKSANSPSRSGSFGTANTPT